MVKFNLPSPKEDRAEKRELLKKRISDFLWFLLQEYGLSQRALARAIDVKPVQLGRWVKGCELAGIEAVLKMSKFSGVSLDEILKSDDYMD